MQYLLSHTIDEAAQQRPEQDAFRCRSEAISYGQLVQHSNQLAHLLIDRGVRPGDRVGIRLMRGPETAVAVFGIMKSGAVFVPVNPALPNDALARLVQDFCLKHLVAHDTNRLPAIAGLQTVIGAKPSAAYPDPIDWDTVSQLPDTSPVVNLTERDLAYIMYTSGSTGAPKGIMHTHRSGLSYAELSVETYQVRSEDRIGNHSPLHFDMSTFGYFASPLARATTVIIPEEHTRLPASLSQLIERERLTIWYSVPSCLIQLLIRGVLQQRDLSSLRWVKYGGEPFPIKHLRALMSQWPHARFSNVYGPAEVNQCTWHHVEPADLESGNPIPIGRIWGNTCGIVLDKNDAIIEDDQPGELAISSATMMRGYWNKPQLTDDSFFRSEYAGTQRVFYRTGDLVQRQQNADFQFLGRLDRQVKTRGHRVDLNDVEAALVACEGVEEAAVWPVDDGEGSRLIEAAVIVQATMDVSINEVMASAKQELPPYAIPSCVHLRDDFPRTATGKIDRRALARVFSDATTPHHDSAETTK